jgi:5'-nucleotidase
MKRRWLIISTLTAAAIIGGCGKGELAEGTVVTIMYSSDVHGKLEGCGCRHNSGGITRRSAVLRSAREEDETVFYCDAGNFLTGTPEVDSSRGRISVAVYNQLGANVVNVSERELALGVEAFKNVRKEGKFACVSANLRYHGSPVTEPYVTRKVKDARIGVIGLCGARNAMRSDSQKLPEGVTMDDPLVSARRCVVALQGKADVIVVLSTCGDAMDSSLAQQLPQLDLIIGGRSYRANSDAPWVIGKTRIVRTERDGRVLGRMDLVFGPDRQVKTFSPSTVRMEAGPPPDEEMLTLLHQFIPRFADNPSDGARIAPVAAR